MADISTEIQAFLDAVYGEEVRSALVSAMNKINDVAETQVSEVEDIIEEMETEGLPEVVDIRTGADGTTYTTAGDAVRGQVSDIKNDLRNLAPLNLFDYPMIFTNGKGVKYATGELYDSSSLKASDYVNVDGISKIIYTKVFTSLTSTQQNGMAFYDANKTYISGVQTPKNAYVSHYENTELDVPENAVYARFTWYSMFDENEFGVYEYNQYVNAVSTQFNETEKEVENVSDRLNNVLDSLSCDNKIDFSILTEYNAFIGSTEHTWNTNQSSRCFIVPVADWDMRVTVKGNADTSSSIAFLKDNVITSYRTPNFCDGFSSEIWVRVDETLTMDIPIDCNYLYVSSSYNSVSYLPESVTLVSIVDVSEIDIPIGLHELPRNESALNIVKRCRQMTDIKWTPAVDLYRFMLVQRGGDIPNTAGTQNYFGTFKAGTEYTGIPYGRVASTMSAYGYDYATVAHYIPLETFVSSVCNPDSKLCKEDVHSLSDHRSVLYATVCSGLTCYALDVPEVPTANIGNISGLTQIGKINDNGTEIADSAFQIGDVLNLAGYHTAIVTDIIRDKEGTIQSIELSDASTAGLADRNYSDGQIGGICRRKGWTRDAIYKSGSWGDYTIYRYTGNVSYTPNPYVNVGDEFNMQRIEHFPCMPYEGNKFTYKTGYIPNNAVKILISLSGYGYLKVFKNGTEISGSPFSVTDETASVDISEISAGTYTAYLCNITSGNVVNMTYPCEWTIAE